MTITVKFNGGVASIVLSGGIDYSTQEEFKKANSEVLSAGQVGEIHVDFISATFLDSAGIRALLSLQKEVDAAGKSLILLNCNENMREIFEIGGFDNLFTFR
ncbi:MAG: hypothetical protein C3F07_05825 [Anaerolineales bacterium]|nr:STAS domain-containing protein [Anaerolineae bacterium]PWB75248.1 MAG: hypothetical protein C3F07_05825 [Anaerolineales bacterium]